MKVQQPAIPCYTRRQHKQPLETITLVPHATCHSDPEEELVTITTQATPGPHHTDDQVLRQEVPGILVTDISAGASTDGAAGLDNTTLLALSGVIASDAFHHTTTTTTSTSSHSTATHLLTTPCVPVDAPAKTPAPVQCLKGVASKEGRRARPQGTISKHTTTSRTPPPTPSPIRQAGSVLGDSRSGLDTADTLHTPSSVPKIPVTPCPEPASCPGSCSDSATPGHHLSSSASGVGSANPDVTLTSSLATCFFCRAVLGAEDTFTSLNLKAPLPHSLLEPTSLLHCLGVTPPASATPTNAVSQARLCKGCHDLLCEGDQAYHHLRGLMVTMKQRWMGLAAGVPAVPAILQESNKGQEAAAPVVPTPAPAKDAKRLRPILPKPPVTVPCGLCGAQVEEWHLHASTQHRLSSRWRNLRLQAALKVSLAKELQLGSGQQGARRCLACSRSFARQEEFVEHLRCHHSVTVDEDFLACLGGAAGAERGTTGQQGGGDEAWLGKEEEEVEEVLNEEQEMEEEEEIVEDEEELIEEEEVIVKDEEQDEEEDLKRRSDSLSQKQQLEPALDECPEESHGGEACTGQEQDGGARRHGCKWRCRVCGAVFTSQRDHDLHKAVKHPSTVRAKRARTRPAAPHKPPARGTGTDGAQQDPERPAAAYQEGTIVILEGDGRGGVTHHRLQPTDAPEPQQDTPPQTAEASGFACPACTEVFADRLALVRHRRAVHPGPGDAGTGDGVVLVECPLCGRRLAGPPALRHHLARVHRRSSHPPMRHRCRLCLCQCHTRPQLERHMRERHGAPPPPPPVRCGRCGKTYSVRYIDSHMAHMHGDAGRFPCTFCPMKYGSRAALGAHVSLEHANTTWSCQECPLQFAKYHQLRQHRLYVHIRAEHRCPECPRSFKRRCDLTEHIKRRHQERQPRECSFCPKVYSDRKRLRMHLMRKHGVSWEDTLARGYARRQRENNCLRRRQQQPRSPRQPPREEEQQPAREEAERGQGAMLGEQQEYSVVHLTETPHPLTDTISYIILEEA